MLTWKQLHDLKCDELLDAADGWAAVSTQADAARDRISNEMIRGLEATQKGVAAPAAIDRLRRLDRNYDYIRTESGLVRTTVSSLVYELVGFQGQLKDALDDAASLGFTVAADGSVSYPAGGTNVVTNQPDPGGSASADTPVMSRPPTLNTPHPGLIDPNPNRAKAQDIADRIRRVLTAAREADEHFTTALNRLKAEPGLDVTAATWRDAAADLAAVRKVSGDRLKKTIPTGGTPADRHTWWTHLSASQRDEYLAACPDILGNLDGIPAAVRDEANRDNLQLLIGKLSGENDAAARAKLDGLRSIDTQLRAAPEPGVPPMYLLGIGEEGNGRAIVSYGNPDTAKNVSAYVPGLGTTLDKHFAESDVKRARETALGARLADPDNPTASIVWLGYDAPQFEADKFLDLNKLAENFAVMGDHDAKVGASAYNQFMAGISTTHETGDPHITAIGHSYGSLTVGLAAQHGGIPGADDIILVGSPGTEAKTADALGVGRDHVFVGAAKNDIVTQLPSKGEASGTAIGTLLAGPGLGGYLGHKIGEAVDGPDQLYFGTDPASREFGAKRFATGDGPPLIDRGQLVASLMDGDMDRLPSPDVSAHSHYFDPEVDSTSAKNIARIVAGKSSEITTQEPR